MLFHCVFLILIVITTITTTNGADDCTEELNKYRECIHQVLNDRKASGEANRRKVSELGLGCFKSNNCNEPSAEQIENNTPAPRVAKSQFANSPDGEKRRVCFEQIADSAKEDIEKCVQQKVANFKFPAKRKSTVSESQRRQGHNYGNLIQFVDTSCSNEQSKTAVRKCLNDTYHQQTSLNPEERRRKAEIRFNQSCAAKDSCLQKVSLKCRIAYNETQKDVCDCAKKEYVAKKAQFDQDYNTCTGATGPQGRGSGAAVKSAQYHGSGVEFLVTSLCKTRDPCAQPFREDIRRNLEQPH